MKRTTSECERLRRLISEREFPTSPLSADLRAAAVSYARQRSSEGASQQVISDELGVSVVSVGRWLRVAESAALVPVSVIPDAVPTSFEVITPRGLRVVGLSIDALCTLLERHG
jgi:DNA-binding transcriptional regulator LsrR (DeoR family)